MVKRTYSWVLFKIEAWFFCVKISLINEHLFYERFVSLSVGQGTKGINVHIKNREFLSSYLRYRGLLILLWRFLCLICIYSMKDKTASLFMDLIIYNIYHSIFVLINHSVIVFYDISFTRRVFQGFSPIIGNK